MAAHVLPAIIAKLHQAAPGIEIEITASNEISDLKRREADIGIRTGQPNQPDLIAKKIKEAPFCLYAASSYLDRVGRPKTTKDLEKLKYIGFDDSQGFADTLKQFYGLDIPPSKFPVLSSNQIVHWELVKQGLGVGPMGMKVGDAEPGVERVLKDLPPIEGPIWLVSHRELRTSRRVRFVFDFLADALQDAL